MASEDTLGIFENSFYLSNYENNLKRPYQEEDDKKDEVDEDEDPRTKKVTKKIESYSIATEDKSLIDSEAISF